MARKRDLWGTIGFAIIVIVVLLVIFHYINQPSVSQPSCPSYMTVCDDSGS